MARLIIIGVLTFLVFSMFVESQAYHPDQNPWFQNIFGATNFPQKLVKIHFYVQDRLSGKDKTVYEVAHASITANSSASFGQVRVIDDLITARPDKNSQKIGRAQGLITFADLSTSALTMNLNIVFTWGKFKGSTICVLGRSQINDKERELAVVGGTGIFRFTRGYAISRTYSYDVETSYGVLEYIIYTTYAYRHNLQGDM